MDSWPGAACVSAMHSASRISRRLLKTMGRIVKAVLCKNKAFHRDAILDYLAVSLPFSGEGNCVMSARVKTQPGLLSGRGKGKLKPNT